MCVCFFTFRDAAVCIVRSKKWEEALRNETKHTNYKMKDTPLRKLIRKMPGLLHTLFVHFYNIGLYIVYITEYIMKYSKSTCYVLFYLFRQCIKLTFVVWY